LQAVPKSLKRVGSIQIKNVMSNYYVDLSESELRQIEGGSFIGALAAGVLITAWAQIVSDWDNFKNGLAGRREVTR
jgi:hypothetical protein